MMSELSDYYLLRRCCRDPIPDIFHAAYLLDLAVGAHLAGEFDEAGMLFESANMQSVQNWTESLWGNARDNPEQKQYLRIREAKGINPILEKSDRVSARMPNATEQDRIISRDGHQCVFCGIPVIRKEVRSAIHRRYPVAVPWGQSNSSQHAAFQCMWLQFDHLLPHSRGGSNQLNNIVVTCAPCNYAKSQYTIEELGLLDPRDRAKFKTCWDGLERFI